MATAIVVLKLNENDDEVIVVELAGGYVEPGQALFSVETSKAVQEVEAEAAGFVLWNAQVGDRVDVLAELGWLFATEEERDGWTADRPTAGVGAPSGDRLATEPARRLAAQLGVSLDDVPGSGIVRESDVRALAGGEALPSPPTKSRRWAGSPTSCAPACETTPPRSPHSRPTRRSRSTASTVPRSASAWRSAGAR